ncbi:MAG: M20/M25/M40 family metallo-hydrolase, partial [Pyrinomonadaceae bacterium]
RVKVARYGGASMEPSAEADTAAPSFVMLQRTIREVYPNVLVAPYLSIGATDARHYARLTPNVYRFLPVTATAGDLRRLHGTDERVNVKDFAQSVRFYRQLIRNSDY